ncbi:ABC transporter ATP-binding protein [Halobacillus massiliensis]|uniref:ABC transporter ATP-binding protein n=1 Tax=Halobacillus massiliensis TaxID=1926286 RepID=UPI0009E46832|nr:ABC transporter ATP-binding protein [Halobacillus massiliensis]
MEKSVDLQNVSHRFSKRWIVKDINMTIHQGEIFGLLGPSGAGKTTLVKLMTGLLQPSKGNIFVHGEEMPSLKQMKSYGFMAQSDALYLELTANENLNFFASIYRLQKNTKKIRIQEVMELVGLSEYLDQRVETFSGGMKRRLSLAAALLHQPELIVLDEPTVGIDPVLRQSIWEELYRLKQQGVTIVVTTHVMDEAEKCDRLAMLLDGRIIAQDPPHLLKQKVGAKTIEDVFLYYGGDTK